MKSKYTLVLALTLYCSSAYAGSIWQKQSNEPCAPQVIVGDSGDSYDSYIISAPQYNSIQEDYDYQYDGDDGVVAFEEGPLPDHMDSMRR